MNREIFFQDKLKKLLEDVSSKYRFDGLEIRHVERDYPVDRKKVDIAVFLSGNRPFLFVETKRKVERVGWKARRFFSPLGSSVVGQAISYVAVYWDTYRVLVPFFATANPKNIAVFKSPRPQNLRNYVDLDKAYKGDYDRVLKPGKYAKLIEDCLILSEELKLTEEWIYSLLDRLAKEFLRPKGERVEPTWALIGYFRGFVSELADACKDLLKLKMEKDEALRQEIAKMKERLGYRPDYTSLAKMMTYVLMNKIMFYKVVEEKYKVPRMVQLDTSSSAKFTKQLSYYFDKAVEVTGNFERIFKTGVYDMLPIPDDPNVMEYINDFIITLDNIRVVEIGELLGYMYEELIPGEERHQLGQFYTPPAICELITKWAIRESEDVVLDPGVGSGGFLLWAYRVLLKLKTGRDALPAPREVHERILRQLYGIDINPFPAHLAAVNLSMRNVRAPSADMNIFVDDFFRVKPGKTYFVRVRTPRGEELRSITLPNEFTAVIGNPPYTRWVEIPESTRKAIMEAVGEDLRKYGFRGGITQEMGIYIPWIIHATKFLSKGGRLGMIISNSWLQASYGVNFANFLLDRYKIKAIIDFSTRLFRIPLIATCVVLLEREEDELARAENKTVFLYVDKPTSVDEILSAIEKPESSVNPNFSIRVVKQGELPRDNTWIRVLFGTDTIEKIILSSTSTIKLGELFDVRYGNIKGIMGRGGTGCDAFFYLNESDVKEWGLDDYTYSVLTSSRYSKTFIFTKNDWKRLRKDGKKCYIFMVHMPKNQLPESVRKYIEYGEKEVKTRSGTPCNKSLASTMRERSEEFYGWYDLGGVTETCFFAPRRSQYMPRFIYTDFPLALDDGFISFKAKVNLTRKQVKALLAYLNSSFTWFIIENQFRSTGGGVIELDVDRITRVPIIDVRSLKNEQISRLTSLFDELEEEARKLGGVDTKDSIIKLKPIIDKIDAEIAEIINLPKQMIFNIQELTNILMERRISRTKLAKPETVEGAEKPKIKPPRKKRRVKKAIKSIPLEKFL